PMIHSVCPIWDPGAASFKAESGGYEVQPPEAAPAPTKKEHRITMQPGRNVQYESAFRNGNAMSRAPVWSGIRKFPKPLTGAVDSTKNTMMVPCIVKSIV